MKKILVTGSGGQLGQCIKMKSKAFKTLDFVFLDSSLLDITNTEQITSVFGSSNYDYCINCAAYTAVDNAQEAKELAYNINVLGAKNLAEACKINDTILIHVSTDFVFDGSSKKPYKETDKTNPLGVYGLTKLKGEQAINSTLKNHYIIRTSWLYSEFGNNFVKTMLRLANDKNELNIVNDQKGTPTNANDLALAVLNIIVDGKQEFGLYHYSNLGETTWYGFAKSIFEFANINIITNPVTSSQFVTKAERPKYSVLDKTKIITVLDIKIPEWTISLENHIKLNYKKIQ